MSKTETISLLDGKFQYRFDVYKDDFTKNCVVKCEFIDLCFFIKDKTRYTVLGMEMTPVNSCTFININFEYCDGKYFLLLFYDNRKLKISNNCALLLLLDNGDIITLKPTKKPKDQICKFQLTTTDLNKLETTFFKKWRITDEEGELLKQADNNCCARINADNNEDISCEVFKQFIIDFRKVVLENAPKEELEEQHEITDNIQRTCHVYLMIDTTNNFHKIGISNSPKYREHTLQSDKPTIELICSKEYPSREIAEAIESALHRVFASKRIRGEWFNLDTTDIENIKQTLM